MDRIARIETRLREAFAPDQLDLIDESADHAGHAGARHGGHFALTIVSTRFRGQSAVARHRSIYTALGDLMRTDIHALRINAYTPEEL
jgi:BolA family transcriptional regulator, general stress-responsive regulator